MTAEAVLRRIEKRCREDAAAMTGYAPTWRGSKGGAIMAGARAEARAHVACCREIAALCREIRKEAR